MARERLGEPEPGWHTALHKATALRRLGLRLEAGKLSVGDACEAALCTAGELGRWFEVWDMPAAAAIVRETCPLSEGPLGPRACEGDDEMEPRDDVAGGGVAGGGA